MINESDIALSYEDAENLVGSEIEKALSGSHELVRGYLGYLNSSGGKLIRAKALLACAMKPDGSVSTDAVRLAAAIEIFHLATLVHDDIIDDAAVRRGKASLHRKFGRKVAVICGDYLFSLALKQLTQILNRKDYADLSVPDFISRVCVGELEQFINNRNFSLSVYRYLKIISGKTAALFEACFFAGAILAGDEENAKKYMRAGRYIGMVFQLNDDCMDYEESEDIARKSVMSDFEQGVVTLPLIYTFSKMPDLTEKALNSEFSADDAVRAVKKSGGIGFTRAVSRAYYEKCLRTIEKISLPDDKRKRLVSILDKAYNGVRAKGK